MCSYDKKGNKVSDCGQCSCPRSTNSGNHNWQTVKTAGGNARRCTNCGLYG